MNLFGWVLFVALGISLVEYASSSSCQKLNSTLFADCVQAGYNVTEFYPNTSPKQLSSLIASMRSIFKNCSSLSSLMTCSVQLPKCPTAASTLPCKDVCRNFVSECHNSSSESDGLIALFRGICELLPTDKCLPTPNNLNNSASEAVKCRRLTVKQCQNAGYNVTSVSDAYQQMVESSAIFRDSDANSTLRKIICMEIAPPCDAKNDQTLIVPCRSMCDKAFNESRSEFVKVFKAQKYCSTFPELAHNTTVDGKEYCSLQTWPNNGYWPSNLWASLTTTGQQPTPVPTVNSNTPTSTATASAPAPTSNSSKPMPTTNVTASVNVSTAKVTTPAPSTKGTKPTSTTNGTEPAPSTKESTPASTANVSSPASTPNVTTPAPSTKGTKPTSTTNGTMPAPSTKESTPASTANVSSPASTPNVTTPAPSTKGTKPTSTTNGTEPAPSTKGTKPTSTTNGTEPAPSTKETKPTSTTNGTKPAPSTKESTPASTANVTSPTSTPNVTTPASSTNGNSPAPSTERSTPSPTVHKSSTSSSPTSGMKGSTPTVVSASTGGKMSTGAIAGTVLGILVLLLAIVVGAVFFRRYYRAKIQYGHSLMVDMDEL